MEALKMGMDALHEILTIPYDIFGYQITTQNIFMFGVIGSIIVTFLIKFFD